ncbi:MAG: prepilin-type N-terminal cleavage/methylation domain-containing protein [Clostridium sp.]
MKKKNNKGFSLIELIIAIAILVILTGLLAPQFMRYMEKSREAKDMQALDTVYGAVQVALADEAAYKDVQTKMVKGGTLEPLNTSGMTLTALIAEKGTFAQEVVSTIGGENLKWSSKAVTKAGGNSATYILIDKDLKVTVWIGVTADATKPLSPTTDPATAGTTFYISK